MANSTLSKSLIAIEKGSDWIEIPHSSERGHNGLDKVCCEVCAREVEVRGTAKDGVYRLTSYARYCNECQAVFARYKDEVEDAKAEWYVIRLFGWLVALVFIASLLLTWLR